MAVFLCVAAGARAGEVSVASVPKPVHDKVKARFKDATVAGAPREQTEEGQLVYEVNLKQHGRDIDVTLTPDGDMRLIEQEIARKDLPRAVAHILDKRYPKPPTLAEESSCFVTMAWDATQGAANADFYRTIGSGPLHNPSVWGVTVGAGFPDPHDTGVFDDMGAKHPARRTDAAHRPWAVPVDPGTTDVGDNHPVATQLVVSPEHNPGRLL